MKMYIFLLAVLFSITTTLKSQMVVNEVMASPPVDQAKNEFIELYNNSLSSVDINGWMVADGNEEDGIEAWDETTHGAITDPDPIFNTTLIPAHSYAVILDRNYATGDQIYNLPSGCIILTVDDATIGNGLTNADPITLKNSSGTEISTYGTPANPLDNIPISPTSGHSVEKKHPSIADAEGNWLESTDVKGTPGEQNSIFDSSLPVELNSFEATPVDNKMVILRWTTQSEVNNHGFYVMRSETEDGIYQAISPLIAGAGTSTEKHSYSFEDKRVEPEGTYLYQLKQVDVDGMVEMHGPVKVELSGKGESYAPIVPAETGLVANFPNPFNPATTVNVRIADETDVGISIYDVLGHHISHLFAGRLTAGRFDFNWNGSTDLGQEAASGVYFCVLQTRDGLTSSLKLVKMK